MRVIISRGPLVAESVATDYVHMVKGSVIRHAKRMTWTECEVPDERADWALRALRSLGLKANADIGGPTIPLPPEATLRTPPMFRLASAEHDFSWAIARSRVEAAHNAGFRGAGTRVVTIDTGANFNHQDLTHLKPLANLVNPGQPPIDDNRHGSWCGSLNGGLLNDLGMAGAAPDAEHLVIKALSAGGGMSWATSLAAIDEALGVVEDGTPVIMSNSWSGKAYPGEAYEQEVEAAARQAFLVFAAGNNGGTPGQGQNTMGYPARFGGVISVAATGQDDSRASFSAIDGGEGMLDCAAGGVSVPGASHTDNDGYINLSGTSAACPIVAGEIACAAGAGKITVLNWQDALYRSTDRLGQTEMSETHGAGIVVADKLCELVPRDPPFGEQPPPGGKPVMTFVSKAFDPDGRIVYKRWSGTFPTPWSAEGNEGELDRWNRNYPEGGGEDEVTLLVQDDDRAFHTKTKTVVIPPDAGQPPPDNEPPVSDFDAFPFGEDPPPT